MLPTPGSAQLVPDRHNSRLSNECAPGALHSVFPFLTPPHALRLLMLASLGLFGSLGSDVAEHGRQLLVEAPSLAVGPRPRPIIGVLLEDETARWHACRH